MRLAEGMWPNNFAALCFLPSANSSRRTRTCLHSGVSDKQLALLIPCGLPSGLRDGVVSQVFPGLRCESAQPGLNCGALPGVHLFKQHAHTEDSKTAAGMHVDHFAVQFARARAIGYAEM